MNIIIITLHKTLLLFFKLHSSNGSWAARAPSSSPPASSSSGPSKERWSNVANRSCNGVVKLCDLTLKVGSSFFESAAMKLDKRKELGGSKIGLQMGSRLRSALYTILRSVKYHLGKPEGSRREEGASSSL